MDSAAFLKAVVTSPRGAFCLASGPPWREFWFNWPEDLYEIITKATELSARENVYFSSYLFNTPVRAKANILPTRTLQADLDNAAREGIPLPPSILVETSAGRHQGYWILEEPVDLSTHETYSRQLTYAIPDCDHSGWPLGRMVRLPGTFNYKYPNGVFQVHVIDAALQQYLPTDFEQLPETPHLSEVTADLEWLEHATIQTPEGVMTPLDLLMQSRVPEKVRIQYTSRAPDRSAALWALLCSGFRAGLDRDQVLFLAYHSANNKFGDFAFNGVRELAKDVLRAEALIRSHRTDVKATILEARHLQGLPAERNRHILQLVIDDMNRSGSFVLSQDERLWYIDRDKGRPVELSRRSEQLETLLEIRYGLNPAETESSYVAQGLVAQVRALDPTSTVAALSFYDASRNLLLLHGGRRLVWRLTPTTVERVANGAFDVLFPWQSGVEPFDITTMPHTDWVTTVFGRAMPNILGFESDEARVLLQVWFLFLLLRDAAVSRPILALFGQPGAGKSTLFRRIYALLYGPRRGLNAVTNCDDFDHAVASDPLVVLDNVDSWQSWLPDRLALSASTSDIKKRKLYTDSDTVTIRRQALLGVTAHDPRFGREDVADRLVLLTFERLKCFVPEGEIIADILGQRDQLWSAIAQDLQRILATPYPTQAESPQFRVEDFARVGLWIARALGVETTFRSALTRVRHEQRAFSLEEDDILVEALYRMLSKKPQLGWVSAGRLWIELELAASDSVVFQKAYKNAVRLGKKLWSLQEALKELFVVEYQNDPTRGVRLWRVTLKGVGDGGDEKLPDSCKS